MGKTGGSGGAKLSTKQLAKSVLDGRKVVFRLPATGIIIEGYLCGLDDYHWMVVTPELKKHLIHKGSASVIDLPSESTLDAEDKVTELKAIINPFQGWVENNLYSRGDQREEEAV